MKRILFTLILLISGTFLFANDEFVTLLTKAKNGDVDAIYNVSLCYQYGYLDVEPDNEQAIFWAKKAADLGNSDAMTDLGIYYLSFENNWKKAKKYFDKAVKLDNPQAYYMLGYCYSIGLNVRKNIKKGISYLEKASELGSSTADYQLGVIYYAGQDVTKDNGKAFNYYLKSAERGNAVAQSQVGYMYGRGIGIEIDKKASFEWNKKAALQDNPRGMISYGCDLIEGKLVEKDIDLGLAYLLKAAEVGNKQEEASVYYILETIYKAGESVEKDIDKSLEYHQKRVDLGEKYANLFGDSE